MLAGRWLGASALVHGIAPGMRRRFWITAALGWAWALAACTGAPQPRYTVSADQLQQMAAQRFPRTYPLRGLLQLDVQPPRLALLPGSNRLSADMAVEASGPALRRSQAGRFTVEFGLRYEPSDRTLRAHQLRLTRLDFPGLPSAVAELLGTYGPALAEQSLREVVLHTLRPQDTAMFDRLGLEPGSITVTGEGLEVAFVRQQR